MTRRAYQKIKPGLYEVYWKSGDSSVASIGKDGDGNTWIAPINWVFIGTHLKLKAWLMITRVVLI